MECLADCRLQGYRMEIEVNSYPILVESDTFAHLAVRQNHWWCSNCHTLLQTLKSFTDALKLGGHQCPRVGDRAKSQLGQVLCGKVFRLTALDDYSNLSFSRCDDDDREYF